MSTGAVIGITLGVAFLVMIVLEIVTLRDKTPDNHITAVVRRSWNSPGGARGAIALGLIALGYLGGHLFWCECMIQRVEAFLRTVFLG